MTLESEPTSPTTIRSTTIPSSSPAPAPVATEFNAAALPKFATNAFATAKEASSTQYTTKHHPKKSEGPTANDKPLKSSTPTAKPQERPKPTFRLVLRRLLTRFAYTTDSTLLRLSKLFSNPSTTDALLCTTNYLLELLFALSTRHIVPRLTPTPTSTKGGLASNIPATGIQKILAKTVALTTSGKKLAEIISDYRIFVRLWGLLGMYGMTRSALLPLVSPSSKSGSDPLITSIAWVEILALWGFQILENGAYLSSKGILSSPGWQGEAGKKRETAWWVWSCRFWAAQVGMEILRVGVLWTRSRSLANSEFNQELHDSRRNKNRNEDTKEKAEEEKQINEAEAKRLAEANRKEDRLWYRDTLSNLAYFPLTLHWSTEHGLLSNMTVGILGTIAGGANLAHAWRATA